VGVEAFGIEDELARDLLTQVDKGETQLSEFQRGWVCPDRNIASLIASISLGYPAGTVMMLAQGGPTRFKTRPVEGARPTGRVAPDWLIVDGQRRLTLLYQSTSGRSRSRRAIFGATPRAAGLSRYGKALRDKVDPGRRRALRSGRQGPRRFPWVSAAGVTA
jgi:hypothetical protein